MLDFELYKQTSSAIEVFVEAGFTHFDRLSIESKAELFSIHLSELDKDSFYDLADETNLQSALANIFLNRDLQSFFIYFCDHIYSPFIKYQKIIFDKFFDYHCNKNQKDYIASKIEESDLSFQMKEYNLRVLDEIFNK